MKILSRGLMAAIGVSALLAAPAGAADVTIRVEGGQRTLVRQTTVQPSSSVTVDKRSQGGTTCNGAGGGGALELATGGDWGGRADAQGQRVERIFSETYLLGDEFSGKFWSFYVNNAPSYVGLCDYTPQTGDEILLAAACSEGSDCFTGDPLDIKAPATARPGEPFQADVVEYTSQFGPSSATATSAPSEGATVAGGGTSTTTDNAGRAVLTFTERGPVDLVATKGGRIRDTVTVCVTDGADGACGTTVPPKCETTGDDGRCGTRDSASPRAAFTGLTEGRTFPRGQGPRTLSGTAGDDPSGLLMVKLRLTRNDGGRCSYFSGKSERFVRARCGAANGKWFAIGDRSDWSYLLPSALPRGRYVLDVNAIDKAYNRDDQRRRGDNRVVFRVA